MWVHAGLDLCHSAFPCLWHAEMKERLISIDLQFKSEKGFLRRELFWVFTAVEGCIHFMLLSIYTKRPYDRKLLLGIVFLSFPSQICSSNEDKFCQLNPDAMAIIWQLKKCSIVCICGVIFQPIFGLVPAWGVCNESKWRRGGHGNVQHVGKTLSNLLAYCVDVEQQNLKVKNTKT